MSDVLADWLVLREPADVAARSETLTRMVVDAVASSQPLHVLDLGTGTGSNVRFLADRLPGPQRWLVIDQNPALLAEIPARMSAWGAGRYDVRVETRQMDLGTLDDPGIFIGRHLVAASALLDLVSEQWLRTLAGHCRTTGAAALFAITYNGRSSCSPAEPEDDMVRDLMNRHQRTDKGLGGPAAGPDAVDFAARFFAEAGYQVQREPSDWTLGPAEHNLQEQLIVGWAEAATEMAGDLASTIAQWQVRRLEHVRAGRSRVVVGHDDLAAWLPKG